MYKAGIAAAVLAGALVLPSAAAAQEVTTNTEPADDATAEAVAAEVDGVVGVGESSARSGQDDAEATGNALTLGGEPPSEQFGGTTKSASDSDVEGNLVDTGETPLGRVQLFPWEARTRRANDKGCRTGSGKAALGRVTVINAETLHINVLQSSSEAQHCGSSSKGISSSDGATVDLAEGALFLTLLHSEAVSGDTGKSFVLSINGNEILNEEQVGGGCSLDLPGLLGLTCLTAGGDKGSVFADVANLAVGGDALTATLVGAEGNPSAAPTVAGVQEEPAAAPDDGARGALAATGAGVAGLATVGAGLAAVGAALRRRFRTAPTA